MKLNGIYFEQTNVAQGHKTMPKYSNLKMKPNLQADIVVFKAKENTLTQEQKALNNLNAMLKQNFINHELNEVNIKCHSIIKKC